MIAAVVLAAGESKRFGRPKQLELCGGRSLVRGAVEAALDGGCRPVLVVLGAHADRVKPEIADLPVEVVIHDAWREGIGSSLRRGVAALVDGWPTAEAVVSMVCDQPRISAEVVRRLCSAFIEESRPDAVMVASAYAGTLGTPALFPREMFAGLLGLGGDRGAQSLLLEHRDRVIGVPWPEGSHDVDRP